MNHAIKKKNPVEFYYLEVVAAVVIALLFFFLLVLFNNVLTPKSIIVAMGETSLLVPSTVQSDGHLSDVPPITRI